MSNFKLVSALCILQIKNFEKIEEEFVNREAKFRREVGHIRRCLIKIQRAQKEQDTE